MSRVVYIALTLVLSFWVVLGVYFAIAGPGPAVVLSTAFVFAQGYVLPIAVAHTLRQPAAVAGLFAALSCLFFTFRAYGSSIEEWRAGGIDFISGGAPRVEWFLIELGTIASIAVLILLIGHKLGRSN